MAIPGKRGREEREAERETVALPLKGAARRMGQTLARDPRWNWGAAGPPGVAREQEVLRGLLARPWDPAAGV